MKLYNPTDIIEARAYRKLLELEEAILRWEEIQKEDMEAASRKSLLKKMQEVGFSGQSPSSPHSNQIRIVAFMCTKFGIRFIFFQLIKPYKRVFFWASVTLR